METNKLETDIRLFYEELIHSRKEYLQLFSELQIQIEGWFRGELMHYFDKHVHKMTNKNREVPPCDDITHDEKLPDKEGNERQKVDLRLKLNDEYYWVELKHILVGYQIKTPISLGFYFSDNSYIDNDIKKLAHVCHSDNKQHLYSLTFISTDYHKEGDKKSRIKKIETPEDLKNKLDDIMTHQENLRNDILMVSWDYEKELHFGYILLKVKNNNDKAQ